MDKMTLFYNKRLGSVTHIVDGEQDMSFFGEEQEDYEKIYDFIIIKHNDFIHRNIDSVIVKNRKVELKDIEI